MARVRTYKPEFWTDEKVGLCSHAARLLFLGILNHVDDYGNMVYAPRQLKAQIFPYDILEVEPLLGELFRQDLAREYEVDGRRYIHIPNFRKHQKIDRPSAPQCPAPPVQRVLVEGSSSTRRGLVEGSRGPTDGSSSTRAEGRKEVGREDKDKERPVKSGDNSNAVQHVGDLLDLKPRGSA